MKDNTQNQKGSVALMALLIMLAVAAISFSVAIIVLGELKSTEDFASATEGYYAAETGLERGLDIVTENRIKKTVTLAQTLEHIKAPLVSDSMSQTFGQNGAKYTMALASNTSVDTIRFNVDPQRSQQLDLYNPDNPLSAANLESLRITWEDNCAGLSWIEMTAVEWAESWTDADLTQSPAEKFFYSCHFSNSVPPAASNECAAVTNVLDRTKSYRVKIKNTSECSIKNATAQVFTEENGEGTKSTYPSQISIQSEGVKGRTKQILTAHVPWQAPASGLLDFVLFSEQPLRK